MRRIVRRNLTRDPAGRPVALESERLTDDGNGNLHVTSERMAGRCSGCGRAVPEFAELRGVCDWCQLRGCCVHCLSQCQLCARRLCGHCRHGFAGPPALTVCAVCLHRLLERQALQDRLLLQRIEFEREQARGREEQQRQSLQLALERMEIDRQIQFGRLRIAAGLPLFPPPPENWPRWMLRKVVSGVAGIYRVFR